MIEHIVKQDVVDLIHGEFGGEGAAASYVCVESCRESGFLRASSQNYSVWNPFIGNSHELINESQ